MDFTQEERMLMMIYNPGSREELVVEEKYVSSGNGKITWSWKDRKLLSGKKELV